MISKPAKPAILILTIFNVFTSLVAGVVLDRTGWTVTADIFDAGFEPEKILDGDNDSFWQAGSDAATAPLPHSIIIDMQRPIVVNGLTYVPRQGNEAGRVAQHTIEVSLDGVTWNPPVAYGTFLSTDRETFTYFPDIPAQFVRLTALSEVLGAAALTTIAELSVHSADPAVDPTTFAPPPTTLGRWGQTINFPVVPVAAALLTNGQVVAWAAERADDFKAENGQTMTSTWDPVNQLVTPRAVIETQHDMFCPGISTLVDGSVFVTGGEDSQRTSAYRTATDTWHVGAEMVLPRGYHSQTTLSNGQVFAIGGSWSADGSMTQGNKHGELYDPFTKTWTLLPDCPVDPILTEDRGGVYAADNHAWLFAWKGASVFQAGPSKAMNWFGTRGTGSTTPAGLRAEDDHAMSGIFAMYDAVNGHILTAGGSRDYKDSIGRTSATHITITEPDVAPVVTALTPMAFGRAYHNAVIAPNGQVLIFGGQTQANVFTDDTATLEAELWDPVTQTFTTLASQGVPRTYHSFALLLTDATVLSGGGGLCGDCGVNHLDAQIFYPPYLYDATGELAPRPVISSVTPSRAVPGRVLTVTVQGTVGSFSFVRYGTATHSVNTDQRRCPLTFEFAGVNTYAVRLPRDPGILLPGPWMLFAMDPAGVPSLAATVFVRRELRVRGAATPTAGELAALGVTAAPGEVEAPGEVVAEV